MEDKQNMYFTELLLWALLQNKQKMVSSKIGFVKRFRLRLSIVSRHSANAELLACACRTQTGKLSAGGESAVGGKNAKWKVRILKM